MKTMARVLFIMAIAMALAAALASAVTPEEEERRLTTASYSEDGSPSVKGMDQYSPGQHYPRAPHTTTCDKYPRICRAPGSPGPDCCSKKCVNVMTDVFNCGECGRRCRYGMRCCGGKCVNVMNDPKNCGACKNKCNKGGLCKYGMCDYA